MSMVPTATERSPCPPGFSLVIITSQQRNGSSSPLSGSSSDSGFASRSRGIIRSRMMAPAAYRPFDENPNPTTGLPSRITSVTTATSEQVIFEKSI